MMGLLLPDNDVGKQHSSLLQGRSISWLFQLEDGYRRIKYYDTNMLENVHFRL